MSRSNDNRRIAKNSLYLYVRKLITVFIGLYASRLLLEQLGLDDFGLYGLVGSVIMLFGSIKVLFTDSIRRFINIEKGRRNVERIRLIFTYGVILNLLIALIFVLIVEVAGVIMIPKLNIIPESVPTAFWVLQFSLASAVVTIMTTPYDAVMIANERFDAFAIFAVVDAVLRFAAVLLLIFCPTNKLMWYSVFMFLAAVIVRILSAIYCSRKFGDEIKYLWKRDRKLLRDMTFFSGWNFLGRAGWTLYDGGINIMLNLFGGVLVNAARSVAMNVKNLVTQFTLDTLSGFRPQTVKSYGAGDMERFETLVFSASKFCYVVSAVLAFMCAVFCHFLIRLWLGEIPPYSVEFVKAIMLVILMGGPNTGINMVFDSSAKLKQFEIWTITVFAISLGGGYMVLYWGAPYYLVFVVAAIGELLQMAGSLVLAHKVVSFPAARYFREVMVRCMVTSAVLCVAYVGFNSYFVAHESWFTFIWEAAVALMFVLAVCYLLMFNRTERGLVLEMVGRKFRRKSSAV
ncbi:MAG: hypothetical protein K2O00_00090 [Muribaculaceae bacterium]|nr:hypothetical protein [Muribaculaceae bacterium]